eukprot:3146327-Pyramimonas_sp.AAC.1
MWISGAQPRCRGRNPQQRLWRARKAASARPLAGRNVEHHGELGEGGGGGRGGRKRGRGGGVLGSFGDWNEKWPRCAI